MLELGIAIVVALALVAAGDWRSGALLVIVIGFAQDVLRKLAPGEPVVFTALVAVMFFAAFIGLAGRGMPLSFKPVYNWHPKLRAPLTLFFALSVVQIVVAYVKTKSLQIAGIGILEYVAPFVGLLFAFMYGLKSERVVVLFKVYVALAAVMAIGIFLEVWGYKSDALGSVGVGIYVYPTTGEKLLLPSGFFRSAENAAWHTAGGLAILIMLVVSRNWRLPVWSAIGLGLLLFAAMLLTGRRKALVEVVMFVMVYGGALLYFRRGASKLALFLVLAGIVAVAVQTLLIPQEEQATYRPYLDRTSNVVEEAWLRFKLMTVGLLEGAIHQNGFFGAGAGTGGQGAQHFGGGAQLVGGGAEGGLGRIAAELGVPGLISALWLGLAFVRSGWQTLKATGASSGARHAMTEGYAAFLLVNVVVFLTASQIFGDPFVVIMLGFMSGFLLSSPTAVATVASSGKTTDAVGLAARAG